MEEILDESPWYFRFKAFITERPNANPVSLGNNNTEVDTGILVSSLNSPDDFNSVAAKEEEESEIP